jgi:hypothetical protein
MTDKKPQHPVLNELEFIPTEQVPSEVLRAEASLTMNPYIRWAKFIMTDDQPNGNGERTPLSEFDNIIQTGINMPIKMAEGKIERGHENASPIGVITHLKKEFVDGINRIVGLAAFWLRERPSDVTFLKDKLENGQDVNLSWELGAQEKVLAEDGVFDWRGVATQAVTVVEKPAYLGRTRIIAMAAKKAQQQEAKWGEDYVKNLPDSNFLYVENRTGQRLFPVKDDKGLYDEGKLREALQEMGKSNLPTPILRSLKATVTTLLDRIDGGASLEDISIGEGAIPLKNKFTEDNTVELEELKQRVAELETKLAAAETSLQERDAAFSALKAEKEANDTQLAELKAFKDEVDAEAAKLEKIDGIKAKFAEAKLNKEDSWFTENEDKLLKTDEASLEFMIQELAAFSAKASLEDGEGKETKIPNLNGEPVEYNVHDIVKALKERKSK